ncbi:MAG TPA: FapA family protein [Syntrophomonadaceae bacterium]|nr:FapA family protein [Syntrophomonadaceae bacterium]
MDTKSNVDSEIRVLVDNDRMKAYVEISVPLGSGKKCSLDDLKRALTSNKIVYGIDDTRLHEALMENNWGKRLLIAEGTPPINGIDGKLIYKFPSLLERMAPKIDEKGNVDYKNLNLIHNVKAGTELVERIAPTEGKNGADVTGKSINARKGKDINLPRGKNTVSDEQGRILYAAIDGHVTVREAKVVVDSVFELKGDVDYSSGNIEFIGNILINGNVTGGFQVIAGGDIEVRGFIEGATVVAGGSIMVRGGITAGIKGMVRAAENISARFVENSRLEAGRDVLIREAIMQSYVKAGGSVKVSDKRATIVGGTIQAAYEVESRTLGSQLATQTIIEVGVNPQYREEYGQLLKTRTEKGRVLETLNHNLQIYQKSGINSENMTDRKRLAIIKLLDEYKKMRQEVSAVDERIAFLETQFEQIHAARIKALEIVYPGVRITIGQAIYVVNDIMRYSQFVLEDGEVRLTSLS